MNDPENPSSWSGESVIASLRSERDTAMADNAALVEALMNMTPEPGFPKCEKRCSSNRHSYDEDNRCDCGMDEIRFRAEAARETLAQPHPGAALLAERDTALAELAEARKKLGRDRARLEAELAEAKKELERDRSEGRMGKPKVEAWAIVDPGGDVSLNLNEVRQEDCWHEKCRVVRLVPADPAKEAELRKLRRVAKLAQAVVDEWGFSAPPDCRIWPTEAAIIEALSALKKGGK